MVLLIDNDVTLGTEFFCLFFPVPVQSAGIEIRRRPVIMDLDLEGVGYLGGMYSLGTTGNQH
jgi:hypothetical protein